MKKASLKSGRKNRLPQSMLTAITVMLKPYLPDITEDAVKQAFDSKGKAQVDEVPERQDLLTRNQVAKMLSVSTRTVDRFLQDGTLKRVPLRGMVRISPQSVREIMTGKFGKEAKHAN